MRLGVWVFCAALFCLQSMNVRASELLKGGFQSTVLRHELPFLIYLPDGYNAGAKHYPVLYLLHGAGGNETTWSKLGQIKSTADRLIAAQEIPPVVMVMPGCVRCWWVDGTKEKAESAFWQELLPYIESNYRTLLGREGRYLAGISAGGHAAIRFALKHPDRFAALAALSPAIYSTVPPQDSAARRQPPFLGRGGRFDIAAWKSQNYPSFLPSYFAQPHRVRMYLMSGDNDRLGIAYETAYFFKQLFERQPELVELRVIDGGHQWNIWSKSISKAMVYMLKPLVEQQLVARQQQNAPPVWAWPADGERLHVVKGSSLVE